MADPAETTAETTTTRPSPSGDHDDSPGRDDAGPNPVGYPVGVKRGICRVCGRTARSRGATYCDDHTPVAQDRAPKPPPSGASSAPAQLAAASTIAEQLEGLLRLAAMMWKLGDPVCGLALEESAEPIAEYWGEQASKSVRLTRAFEAGLSSQSILAGIVVHAPLVRVVFTQKVAPVLEARRAAADAALELHRARAAAAAAGDAAPWQVPPDEVYVPDPSVYDEPLVSPWAAPAAPNGVRPVRPTTLPDPAADAAARGFDGG